ncbi:ACT domain-containing protein [Candidatus Daviesbacteria bacterium]|nr:ACT domain-containing protein [Candidatus Daviesbacteria bacterium]
MNDDLKKIIESSTSEVIPGRFIYAKVSEAPQINNHFLVSKDKDEITVVTEEKNLEGLKLIEKNKDYWALIALNVSAPFYSVGFLAAVSSAIAKEIKDVLIVSTYSKDYILVQYDFLEGVKKVLLSLGFKEK